MIFLPSSKILVTAHTPHWWRDTKLFKSSWFWVGLLRQEVSTAFKRGLKLPLFPTFPPLLTSSSVHFRNSKLRKLRKAKFYTEIVKWEGTSESRIYELIIYFLTNSMNYNWKRLFFLEPSASIHDLMMHKHFLCLSCNRSSDCSGPKKTALCRYLPSFTDVGGKGRTTTQTNGF